MSYAPDAKNLLMGRGEIYFDRFVAGSMTKQGEVHLGNCSAYALNLADDVKEKKSSMSNESVTLRTVTVGRDISIKVTGDEFSETNLAMALMGSEGTLSQGSGTVTTEVLTTSAKQGRWYKLANRSVSSVVITGKTVNTDYKVDATLGRIYIVPGGTIADGASVTVASYSYAAVSSLKTVVVGDSPTVEGYLRFVGNPAAGPVMEAEFWKVAVIPNGDLGLISDDFANWSVTFKVLDDSSNHPTAPYGQIVYNGNN